jgi:hypothetical protein
MLKSLTYAALAGLMALGGFNWRILWKGKCDGTFMENGTCKSQRLLARH